MLHYVYPYIIYSHITRIFKYKCFYSDLNSILINPWFITGFVDAEGSFIISINSNKELKNKWGAKASFKITLHLKDKALLEQIQAYFGVGNIYVSGSTVLYEVSSLKDLEIIINHFNNYCLISQKWSDFELFKLAVNMLKKGEHLTLQGLKTLISIRASMNKGLSDKLKAAFPDIIPITRPLLNDRTIPDPNWISGFTSGEGCFMVRVRKSSTSATGYKVELIFQITQHSRDEILIKNIIDYLDCGKYRVRKGDLAGDFIVYKFSDLIKKIIPFFEKYPIMGVKQLEFKDFKSVTNIMQNKEHLTKKGVNQIIKIQSNMNTKRIYD